MPTRTTNSGHTVQWNVSSPQEWTTVTTNFTYAVPGPPQVHEPSDSCPEDCPKCRALFRKNGKAGRDMD